MGLLYSDARMDKAVAFCWEVQQFLSTARFEGWDEERLRMHMESYKQLWRRFPAGVRSSAHTIFMEQLNEQLSKATDQRDSTKPVWLNEQLGHSAGIIGSDSPSSS